MLHTKIVLRRKKRNPSQKRMGSNANTELAYSGRRSDVSSYSSSSEEEDLSHGWRERAVMFEKENLRLKNKVEMLEDKVKTMIEEQEQIRKDVVRRSQLNFECDADLYRKINNFTRKTLFRHVKFITSERMLNDLESKMSLGNITMNHFKVEDRDKIAWWRACSGAVADALCNQRSTTAQAIKAQVMGK